MTAWRATIQLVIQRAMANPALVLLRFVGILVAVGLVCAVSLYSATMADTLLQASLSPHGEDVEITVQTSPGQPGQLPYTHLQSLDRYLRYGAANDLGLPVHTVSAHFTVPNSWSLTAWGQTGGAGSPSYGSAYLEYLGGFAQHARVVAGTLPAAERLADGSVPVAIERQTAATQRLHVGQRLGLVIGDLSPGARVPPLTIAAIYTRSPGDPFWQASSAPMGADPYAILTPRAFSDLAMLSPESNPQYAWVLGIAVKAIRYGASDAITANLTRFTALARRQAPGTDVFTLLGGNLATFKGTFALLGALLYLLAAPVILIVLYYLSVSTELVMDHQSGEIVLLRSRGAAPRQVLTIYLVESALMGIVAVLVGPFVAIPIAYKVGQTSGFLSFSSAALQVGSPDAGTFVVGAIVAVLAVLAGVAPAFLATRRTMTSAKQEQGRSRQRPLWQRFYVDLVLLGVALYGYTVLARQGPSLPAQNQSAITQDPFVALAPGLFVLAGTLVFGRALPAISALVARLLQRGAVPVSMAVQSIARTPRQYVRLAMLLSLTLSIGVFAAAVAGTIGANLADQYRYQAGTNLRLVEQDPRNDMLDALPAAWHARLPGVRAASPALRFESYQSDLAAGSASSPVEVLGIDPATFGNVAWFRPDFASAPLGALLARLRSPTLPGALVSQSFVDQSKVRVGDQVQLSLAGAAPTMITVLGVVRYFPTLDPPEHVYIVANMAWVRALAGVPGPSEVWMRTDGDPATARQVIAAVQRGGRVIGVDYEDRSPGITVVDNPLQVGIYGVTSIGFIIAAGLSMLGLVAYLYLSIERRATDFGVLRALGSSPLQVAAMLLLEQLFLVVIGVLAALVIGLLGGHLFIPYLPIAQFTTPPFLVDVPWQDVVRLLLILLAAFAVALAVSAYAIARLQISKVLRLGEA